MKVRLWTILVLLIMLPSMACAEIKLTLSTDFVASGGRVDFAVEGAAAAYRYTLTHEDEELFSTETSMSSGSYMAREPGEYTLKVEAANESATAAFGVTEALSLQGLEVTPSVRTGQPLRAQVQCDGGTGNERYFYTVYLDGEPLFRAEGSESWRWVPDQAGEYELLAVVQDQGGAQVEQRAAFTVEEGGGLSVESTGGELGASGGQKSWTVYAVEPWTAQTDADFLTLENTEGPSGGSLTVTAETPTDEYREGTILLQSGNHELALTVSQSAGYGVDEEVSLFAQEQTLYVDNQTHAVWTNAEASRSFRVKAAQAWTVETDADFIHIAQEENEVVLTVEEAAGKSVRSGLVTLTSGESTAYVHVYQPPVAQASNLNEVTALPASDSITLYSQQNGFWKDKKYGESNLQKSGCAIFALNHALQCIGFEGEEIDPETLGRKYGYCLRDSGTVNGTLVGAAAENLGFRTRFELYDNVSTIKNKIEEDGAVFSFSVVSGHIAMVAGISSDGKMVLVLDSAPSATWERLGNNQMYIQNNGMFVPINSLTDLPGIRYYPETDSFGGAAYWMEAKYAARRGLRLIQPR